VEDLLASKATKAEGFFRDLRGEMLVKKREAAEIAAI